MPNIFFSNVYNLNKKCYYENTKNGDLWKNLSGEKVDTPMAKDGTLYLPPIIYPHIPWEGKGKILVNQEFMAVKGEVSYFSLDYGIKNILLEELLGKYRKRGFLDILYSRGLYIRYRETDGELFVKKSDEIVDAIKSVTFKTGKFSLLMYDVLAYQKVRKGSFLLTADGLYSPTELEEYGRYIALRGLGWIDKGGIYGKNGDCLYRGRFSANFVRLATELIALNRRIGKMTVPHPLCRESADVRERYMAFLVYRLCADRGITADRLMRAELIAGQLRVSSGNLSDMIGQVLVRRKWMGGDQGKYFAEAFALFSFDISDYRDILYYDILALELFQSGGKVRRRVSYFTRELENRLGIPPAWAQSYMECRVKAGKGELDLLEAMRHSLGEEQIRHRMIAFELEIQKKLIGGSENGD